MDVNKAGGVDRPAALPDEEILVEKAKRGDKEAFESLYRAYAPRIYAAVYGIVMNRDDALDVVQISFLRAWRALPRFKKDLPFFPWMYTIARNRALSCVSKRKSQPDQIELHERHGGLNADHDRAVALREDLSRALARLSPEHREVIVLRHFQVLSYQEIAQAVGCPVGTVMSRLYNARKALRGFLHGWED